MTLFIGVVAFIAGVVVCAVAEEYFGKNANSDTAMSEEWARDRVKRIERGDYTPRNK